MFPEDLVVTDTNKEDIFELKSDYPCCVREVTASGKKQIITWHWHEELEFVHVLEGALEYWTAGKRIYLKRTEGIFVNANVMHQVTVPKDTEYVRYQVFMLRSEFLAEEGGFWIKNISDLFCRIINFRQQFCTEKVWYKEKSWKICMK